MPFTFVSRSRPIREPLALIVMGLAAQSLLLIWTSG